MFLYLATSVSYGGCNIIKLGMTQDLYGRLSTYQTSCPPCHPELEHDIAYVAVWETDAQDRTELFNYEDILHNQFIKWRMMRYIPGDSEWFDFKGCSPLDVVCEFMKRMPWVKREVPLSEIAPINRPSRQLHRQYAKNTNFIYNRKKRNDVLNQEQAPVILAIQEFTLDDSVAGQVIAPCGSGKTLMTCKGIKGLKRVIICCPRHQILRQWISTLISEGVFTKEQIISIGSDGTTNQDTIRTFMHQDTYCAIVINMSSTLLVDILPTSATQIIIPDEAHHMAGVISETNEDGGGMTRRLMMKATELCVKRLFLTFTPRNVTSETECASMDDINIFGRKIAELKLRDLIRKGVLPDYRIWHIHDSSKKGTGITGKADCILEAWSAEQMGRDGVEYILHHLVVFAATNEEARQFATYFTNKTTDTLVICVKGGDDLEDPIRSFSEAKRAIIVNCKVLGEGVDIPPANAVAVTYPKYSAGEITQMLLRAGRWYENKPIFHILLPTTDDDDMHGFENVLMALASHDDQICDEVIHHATTINDGEHTTTHLDAGGASGCIMMDNYDGSNAEEIRKCFVNVRNNMFRLHDGKHIRKICIDKGIDTSVEYFTILRTEMPELPEDPKPKNSTWYDYLHPQRPATSIQVRVFVNDILEPNNLCVGHEYDVWRELQPSDIKAKLPSVQHITDGYFDTDTNFNGLREKFGKKTSVGRR